MRRFLLPVDASEASLRAVDHVMAQASHYRDPVELHLLNVQHALPSDVSSHIPPDVIKSYHHDEGIKALASARAKLDASSIPYVFHIGVGDPGHVIAHFGRELKCDEIVMTPRGLGATHATLGSVSMKVVHYADRPVVLVK